MKLKYHKTLSEEKWLNFPVEKRILMIATEFVRAKNWIEKEDFEEVKHCYERALELLDLTLNTVKGNLLREFCRFREIVALSYQEKAFTQDSNQRLYITLLSLNKDSFNLLVR
ncbi:MAG: hypothetical protein DRP68_04770 [Candidatus Omnitrophota bacterium]|nr:MAG: hypothetical protein DRP68_04770 [Candidatus Omnitrophota bacterium]